MKKAKIVFYWQLATFIVLGIWQLWAYCTDITPFRTLSWPGRALIIVINGIVGLALLLEAYLFWQNRGKKEADAADCLPSLYTPEQLDKLNEWTKE